MRMLRNGCFAMAASLLLASAAHAVPLTANAVPPSDLALSITAGALGTGSGSGAITGSASTDITITPTNVSTVGGSGSFTVANFTVPGLALGALAVDNLAFTVTLPASTSTNGSNPFHPDLSGSVIDVDQGTVTQGSSTLFDFTKTPSVLTAPPGSVTTLNVVTGVWTVPFTTTSTLTSLGVPVNIGITTDLVLQAVPEPGTLLLLGAGVGGLVMGGRRKKA